MINFIIYIIHMASILSMCCIASWECSVVSYYQNTNIILASEIQGYDFTFIASIMNMFTVIFLLCLFFDKNILRLSSYLMVLLILNLVMGLWVCSLYEHTNLHGRFDEVIIIELNLFIIKCILFFIMMIYVILSYVFRDDNTNTEYSEVLIATPIN